MKMPNQKTRAYIYRVLVAAVPLLILFGVVTAADATVWLGLAGSILGLGLATANTSTNDDPNKP